MPASALYSLPNHIRPFSHRSNAPTPSAGPPPATHRLLPPQRELPKDVFEPTSESESVHDTWANGAVRFSTLAGALSLRPSQLQALQPVPHDIDRDSGNSNAGRVTRTRTLIKKGQRIDFCFGTGGRALRQHGMPMYALANASEDELGRYMSAGKEDVMALFPMRRIRIRILWPLPYGLEESQVMYEEWMRVDSACTRIQLAMGVAGVFYGFVEQHRASSLARYRDYPWLLLPDAFYRVWLLGIERIENNVFLADLKYVKDFPEVNR